MTSKEVFGPNPSSTYDSDEAAWNKRKAEQAAGRKALSWLNETAGSSWGPPLVRVKAFNDDGHPWFTANFRDVVVPDGYELDLTSVMFDAKAKEFLLLTKLKPMSPVVTLHDLKPGQLVTLKFHDSPPDEEVKRVADNIREMVDNSGNKNIPLVAMTSSVDLVLSEEPCDLPALVETKNPM